MRKQKQTHTIPSSHQGRNQKNLERRRFKAAKLFAKGETQAEVARRCGVSREASRIWYQAWKKQGFKGLASKKPGPKPKLTEIKKEKVRKALLKGPRAFGYSTDFWTLKRIAGVIRKVAKVSHHPGHIWYILRDMGWTCQKPEKKAKERNEKAIKNWLKNTWPRIKKKG